jgi:hypothetical protein
VVRVVSELADAVVGRERRDGMFDHGLDPGEVGSRRASAAAAKRFYTRPPAERTVAAIGAILARLSTGVSSA